MMDKECKHYVKGCFKKAELIYKRFYHIFFLEICKSFNLMPKGLEAKKRYCVGGTSENFEQKWDANLPEMEIKCRRLLLEEHCEKLFCLMDRFWEEIAGANVDLNWLVKVRSHLDKIEKEQEKVKPKKMSSLSRNSSLKKMVFERFNEHLPHFQFKSDYFLYCNSQCPDFKNLYKLLTISKTYKYRERLNATSKTYQDGTNLQEHLSREEKNNDIVDVTENPSEPGKQYQNHQDNNTASLNKTRLEGKFVSKNVINLSKRNLSRSEISLLSKGLKFVPSANKLDRATFKRELEEYGRKLRLIWHFRNDERTFSTDKVRPKSSFNPKNKDAIIETYLSSLEERLLDIEIPSRRYNNLTKEERDAFCSLRDDSSIIIKGADKGSVVVFRDREDYLKEAYNNLRIGKCTKRSQTIQVS